jgi:hypothetical protein
MKHRLGKIFARKTAVKCESIASDVANVNVKINDKSMI